MIKKLSLFLVIFCFWLSPVWASAEIVLDSGEHLYPHIQKVDNGLYFAKMKGQHLYLAMERVTKDNIRQWRQYAAVQSNPRVVGWASTLVDSDGSRRQGGSTGDGAAHFGLVLDHSGLTSDEVWVAYVTSDKDPKHIPDRMTVYSAEDVYPKPHGFASHIKMYVTVTSSPQALITSHMGIAASAEGVKGNRPKGISVPLHSFAAQVMKRRNPDRRYMVNAPVPAMTSILLEKMPPHSVFVGTREMRKEMKRNLHISFEEFLQQNPNLRREISEKIQAKAKKELNRENSYLQELLSEEARLTEVKEIAAKSHLLEMNPDGFLIISKKKMQDSIKERVEQEFEELKNPWFLPSKEQTRDSKAFLKIMENHPPLLSVDKISSIENSFIIYDRDNPNNSWLQVEKGNPDYRWIFTDPFHPAGSASFIVIDLTNLADAAPVEKA